MWIQFVNSDRRMKKRQETVKDAASKFKGLLLKNRLRKKAAEGGGNEPKVGGTGEEEKNSEAESRRQTIPDLKIMSEDEQTTLVDTLRNAMSSLRKEVEGCSDESDSDFVDTSDDDWIG